MIVLIKLIISSCDERVSQKDIIDVWLSNHQLIFCTRKTSTVSQHWECRPVNIISFGSQCYSYNFKLFWKLFSAVGIKYARRDWKIGYQNFVIY